MATPRLINLFIKTYRLYASSVLRLVVVLGIGVVIFGLTKAGVAQGQSDANPPGNMALAATAVPTTYTLQAGEYPYCIARRFNVNPDELLKLNGLTLSSQVRPGKTLQIPQTGHTFPGTRALHASPAVYTVKAGDTIYTIACYYGDVDPMAIAASNGILAPYTLTAGQTLQIPGSGPTLTPSLTPSGPTPTGATPTPSKTPTLTTGSTYTLQPGEYPYCIARRLNLNPDELLTLNGLSRYQKVSPGTVLNLPQTGHTFPGTRALHPRPAVYTVAPGDTLYAVACYYGDVEPMAIAAANGISAPYTLTSGQTLQIPGEGPTLTPSLTPTGPTATPSSTSTPGTIPATYTLHTGEYPYCLARRFNVNPDELLNLNSLTRYQKVNPGTVLQIPQTGNPFPGTRALHAHPTTYTVVTGDTIYSIACYFGDVDPLAIAAANGLASPYTLTSGQTLQIPGSGPALTATPTGTAGPSSTPTLTLTSSPTATLTSTATLTPSATPLAFTNCASIVGLAAPVECEALVALYNNTNGAAWSNRTGWLSTNAPCSWYGVTCAAGHITTLALGRNALNGTLPAQLGNMSSLITLQINENVLGSAIPTNMTSLTALTSLDISYNMLGSEDAGLTTFLNSKQAAWANTQTVPPTGLTASAITSNSVQLSWTPIAYSGDGGSYEVLYATTAGGPYTSHGNTSDKTATGYNVTGLTPSTPYYFVVRAITPAHGTQTNALTSGNSTEISATTTP